MAVCDCAKVGAIKSIVMTTKANTKIGDWYRFFMDLIMDIPNLNHRKILLFEQFVYHAWPYQYIWSLLANLQIRSQSKLTTNLLLVRRGAIYPGLSITSDILN